MNNFSYCQQALTIISEKSHTFYEPFPFMVQFNFSCKPILAHWILHQNSRIQHLSTLVNSDKIHTSIRFTLQHLLWERESRFIINDVLKHWPLNESTRKKFIDHAYDRALEAVKSMPAQHNVAYIDFKVMVMHNHVFDERRVVESILQRSMEEDNGGMVPALESSIESLKKLLVEDGTCLICLEELSADGDCTEGVCMPCSHIFHENCIKKWLRTSHYCPTCRYKMPTELDHTKSSVPVLNY